MKVKGDVHFLLNFLSGQPFRFLKGFIEKESDYLGESRFMLYSTDENLGITVLTDTTERAPTFNLNPFENFQDNCPTPSNFYLFFPHSKDSKEAWELLLGRKPRTLDWNHVVCETSYKRLIGFDFSRDLITKRKSLGVKHDVFFQFIKKEKALLFKLGDLEHYLVIENNKPIIFHIILKIVLNTFSTLSHGKTKPFSR